MNNTTGDSPMNTLSTLTLPTLLGEEKLNQLVKSIDELRAAEATKYTGVWDASTGFAVFVLIKDGTPFLWRMCGPLTRDQAKTFFDAEASALAIPGAGVTSH